ncbi:MAG: diguanylate cyclase, partial [Planctomycetes bacterium]|nr:diguanylate cyclase [Planctomycetota bacterium]
MSDSRRLDTGNIVSEVDDLTGLPSRRAMAEYLEAAVNWKGARPTPFCILLCDVDDFKSVGQLPDRTVGDRILLRVVQILRETVGESVRLFRYAGDQFLLFASDTDRKGAITLGETVRARVATETFIGAGGAPLNFHVSVGISTFPDDAQTARGLLGWCQLALRQAKKAGKDRVFETSFVDIATLAEKAVLDGFPCRRTVVRERETATFIDGLRGALRGTPALCLVSGPAGVGKTRFLAEAMHVAENDRWTVLPGALREEDATLPYAALLSLIERHLRANPPAREVLQDLPTDATRSLVTAYRHLGEHVGGGITADLGSFKRPLLFEAMLGLLRGLAVRNPLLLAIDDAEFLDEASADLLRHALSQRVLRLAVIAACRDEALEAPADESAGT